MVAITKLLCAFSSAVAVLASRFSLSSKSIEYDQNTDAVFRNFRQGSASQYHHVERKPSSTMALSRSKNHRSPSLQFGASSSKENPQLLDELELLNKQFQNVSSELKSASRDNDPNKAISEAFWALFDTLENLNGLSFKNEQFGSVMDKLDDINKSAEAMRDTLKEKAGGWEESFRAVIGDRVKQLETQMVMGEDWIKRIDWDFKLIVRDSWVKIEKTVSDALDALYSSQGAAWNVSKAKGKSVDEPKSILEGLETLNAQFQQLNGAFKSFSEDRDSQLYLQDAFVNLHITLTALARFRYRDENTESDGKSVLDKLDEIKGTVNGLGKTIADKARDWKPEHRRVVVEFPKSLVSSLYAAKEFVFGMKIGYRKEVLEEWAQIVTVVENAAMELGKPASAKALIQNQPEDGVVLSDFLSKLQEGVHDLTSALQDYKPNDLKKEEAINQPMDKLLTVLGGTLQPSRKRLSPAAQKQAFNRLHDLSFAVDDMLDALFDVKREDLTPTYRNKLAEDFHNLDIFAGLLTDWVEDLANGGNHEVSFWRHIISVFQGAASALGDFEETAKGVHEKGFFEEDSNGEDVDARSKKSRSGRRVPALRLELF